LNEKVAMWKALGAILRTVDLSPGGKVEIL